MPDLLKGLLVHDHIEPQAQAGEERAHRRYAEASCQRGAQQLGAVTRRQSRDVVEALEGRPQLRHP